MAVLQLPPGTPLADHQVLQRRVMEDNGRDGWELRWLPEFHC
ncbi:hypothetical protein Gotri_005861 [Gossypium trilobum]|uniref:Uncharacterized protein n=1 Tax=Gossypium trilobum TaxID=34281 RepID=A0A7J9EXX3_9ROSI|nr:hypothetical protein [Gossypium trilobum]